MVQEVPIIIVAQEHGRSVPGRAGTQTDVPPFSLPRLRSALRPTPSSARNVLTRPGVPPGTLRCLCHFT
jgi:hypothetical protein